MSQVDWANAHSFEEGGWYLIGLTMTWYSKWWFHVQLVQNILNGLQWTPYLLSPSAEVRIRIFVWGAPRGFWGPLLTLLDSSKQLRPHNKVKIFLKWRLTFSLSFDKKSFRNLTMLFRSWATCRLLSWWSEATPSATPFFKRAYKISHPPWL